MIQFKSSNNISGFIVVTNRGKLLHQEQKR